jgi:hypothetical protein
MSVRCLTGTRRLDVGFCWSYPFSCAPSLRSAASSPSAWVGLIVVEVPEQLDDGLAPRPPSTSASVRRPAERIKTTPSMTNDQSGIRPTQAVPMAFATQPRGTPRIARLLYIATVHEPWSTTLLRR